MARTAEIVRDARIGEAEANRDAQIEVAIAEEQRLAAKLCNKTEVERAKRDFELKKATYDLEIETARAEAELAYKLQECKVRQRIKEETMTTEIIERMKFIEVAEQEVARKQCELDAKIRKPADAEKYRCQIMAEANKQKTLCEAASASDAIAMRGDADAFAIEIKAKAEAEVMAMKADAWKEYKKAAKVQMWMEALPSIAAEVAAPLSQTNKITMIGFTDQNESLGPARLTNEVLNIMEKIPESVTAMTGHRVKNSVGL